MQDFTQYMEICEALAESALSKGNSMVGSLILLDGKIVAKAEETATSKKDISCHAEMEVIRKARKIIGKNMSGAILISNKEPCVMCSYSIRFHRIDTVIYKAKSKHLGGCSGHFNLLTSNQVPKEWGPPVTCIQIKK
ncbi:hypothetical protein MACH07_22210 [Flagellimonas marinaquae]|uniref:CMP/dCMP-type deaminase domain-containing protein n=1 Tax=Flagellimonas marinaquae TaxID=254955 RepID=A0AA48HPN5_9FLAO|nr:hypothetical protein MACH07_22210 [Allomuricauda aquimarina]